MKYEIGRLNADQRALEKQDSREKDAVRLRDGTVSGAELRRENGIASRLPLYRYKMSAIGGKPITKA